MPNKSSIIDKLWNDRPLSNEEIVYISKNMTEDNNEVLSFNHGDDIIAGSGVSTEDIQAFNKKFSESAKNNPIDHETQLVERIESFATDPKFLRIIVVQAAQHAIATNQALKTKRNPWE